MKYVAICGGLGNQMFQYAYYLMLQSKGYDVSTFIPSKKWEHIGGYELARVFGIEHKSSVWERLYHIGSPFTRLFTLLHKTYFGKNFKVKDEDFSPSAKCGYFYGTWQSEKYFVSPEKIREAFRFDTSKLSPKTIELANYLKGKLTVSVHIRRGDYLSGDFSNGFGKCCDIEYYHKAIQYISKTLENITFVFFSDDMEWVKKELPFDNAIYADHNHGVDSWQDMYLMNICQHNIIANSTFSWWGAWLNSNEKKIVIAPKRWWNTIENDDVVPESWIRM